MSGNGTLREKAKRSVGPVSFSRNVRWFIAALTGFLIFVILFLLLQLQTSMAEAAAASLRQQQATAVAARSQVEALENPSSDRLRIVLDSIRAESGAVGIELSTPGGAVRSGAPGAGLAIVEQPSERGLLRLYFDAAPFESARREFYWIAGVVIAATLIGLILLLLLLPRITRPIDIMLRDASRLGERGERTTDERYLIDTFRTSIETLHRQEEELRRLHEAERTRADDLEKVTNLLTRNLTSGFIAIDSDGNITRINQAGQQILGFSPPDGPIPIRDLPGLAPLSEILEESHREATPLNRVEIVLPDETSIGLTTVPVQGEEGESLGTLALFTDLSEVKRLERRMRDVQALASLGEISAGIAHELRNSLSTLLGYLTLARRQTSAEDRERRLNEADAEGRRMSETVSSLLNFARPISARNQSVRLDQLVGSVVDRLESAVPIAIEARETTVIGDPALLGSAVENIVRNALEALEGVDRPSVRISVIPEPRPSLVVRDNGPGIDPELLPKIFLPFTTGKSSGTGMGLALTRKIILQHDGEIRIESEPGKGASVIVELP